MTEEAGDEEGRPHEAQGRQGKEADTRTNAFNVCTAAFKGVNGIGHIDVLLRICAATGCDVIGLQETKRDGISEILAAGYRVYFSGYCSGVKGRKG